MLDKLIESKKDTKESRRLGGFLSATSVGAFFVLTTAFIYSIFAADIALASSDDLMLSALVAPVQIAEEKPREEIATAAPKQTQAIEKSIDKLPTRRENMMRVDEQPIKVPDTVSVNQNQAQARPEGRFKLGASDLNPASSGAFTNDNGRGTGAGSGAGSSDSFKPSTDDAENTVAVAPPPPPAVVKPVEKPVEQPKKVITVSGGVINGKASNLVTPVYSAAAKAVRAQGEVRVAVTIDESGRVVAANAVGGNPLLTAAAVNAARASKFTPTLLSNHPVRVTGIIIYNFKI